MNSAARKITVGEVFSDWAAIAGRNWQFLALVAVVLGVVNGIAAYLGGQGPIGGVQGIFNIIAAYFVLVELLRRERLMQSKGSVWAYIGASLLAGLGIIVGFVLLIVPGLYLMARWSIAPSLVLARDKRTTEALALSWEATRESAWTLVLVFLAFFVVVFLGSMLLGFVIGVFVAMTGPVGSPILPLATQLLGAIGSVLGVAFSVAIFHLLAGGTREYEDAFA